ncbi:HSPB1-associated protein 1-like [Daphnia carinata]|uniref:HSPB1-associated protein 1-like n=1 Tax=Daphnia carinata TaxID=120202 RepID=UPI002580C2B5|nr:HSPB1-associated protein 1-like [Daphnia carinata]
MATNSPDPAQIRRLISRVQKPLVFRGLIDSWPMLKFSQSEWNNLFHQMELECRVGSRNSRGDQPQWEGKSDNIKCSYSEFIKWSENSSYVRNPEMSDLETDKHFLYYGYKYMKDIFNSEVLRMTEWKAFGYPEKNGAESTFWMGTAGAHTPCHYDTYGCNLVAQLSGRKRWILFPPEDTDFLKPTRVPYEESSVYSRINFEKWIGTIPDIEGTHPHVVDLLPGDVLFVPRHWWHHVRNEELSISINTWLELTNDDQEARLHESLVKFFVAHTSRNLPPNLVSELLNPNEEDMAYADLDEIQNFVQYCFKALKDNETDSKNVPEDVDALPDEPWILPVICKESSEPKVKKARSADAHSKIEALDIVRAFCHPRVIETVSQILKNEFKT